MKTLDFGTLERICARRSEEFDRLEAAAYEFAGPERVDRPIAAACRKHSRILDRMPEGFQERLVGALVLYAIFGSEPARLRFLRRSGYATEDREAFDALCGRPWRFAFLQIRERLSEGFFSIHLLGDSDEAVLFSPSIEKIEVDGRPLLLCGLFGDGTCIQSFGPIVSLPAFDIRDVEAFAKLASPDSYAAFGLSGVLGRDPLPFILLAEFGAHRLTFGNSGALQYAAGTFRYREGFAEQAKKLGAAVAAKGGISIDLQPEDRPDSFVKLDLDEKRRSGALAAASAQAYREAARRPPLAGLAPTEPEYLASPPMILAIGEILGKPFPGLGPGRPSEGNAITDENRALQSVNEALREYTGITNRQNVKPDARAIARKHGTDPEQFAALVARFERDLESRFHIDLPGRLEGFEPPPPEIRFELSKALSESALFVLHDDEGLDRRLAANEALYQPALPRGTRGYITAKRLPGLLERATKEYFGTSARTVLCYTLFLLLETGRDYRPVRDYGSELLKTFWQVLIPDRTADYVADFLEDYARWSRDVLAAFDLAIVEGGDLSGSSAPRIKRSPFLEDWIARRT